MPWSFHPRSEAYADRYFGKTHRQAMPHGEPACCLHGSPTLPTMFLFFSSRLGCLGSIVVSVLVTIVLLAVFGLL